MEDDLEDMTLVASYRDKGDTSAIDRLVTKYGRSLLSYLTYSIRNKSDAEEVFQETWIKVIKRIASFRGGSFKAWLTTIARNCLIDRARREKPSVSLNAEYGEDLELVDTLADKTTPDPFATLNTNDTERRIRAALNTLPENQREIFLLRMEQELSFAEIAKLLKISINTALARMRYAILKLRKELADL